MTFDELKNLEEERHEKAYRESVERLKKMSISTVKIMETRKHLLKGLRAHIYGASPMAVEIARQIAHEFKNRSVTLETRKITNFDVDYNNNGVATDITVELL